MHWSSAMSSILNSPWWSPERSWGFRFSRGDLVIVLIGALATLAVAAYQLDLAVAIPIVVGHFFLFCNVFRVGRTAELVWAGLLLLNAGGWLMAGHFCWGSVVGIQCLVTLTVIVHALRSPDYHGLGCQRINPLGYRWSAHRQ
jgi:hypothetical protein